MALIAILGGALLGGASTQSQPEVKIPKARRARALKRARLEQFQALGGDISEFLLQPGDKKSVPRSQRVRFGKESFRLPTIEDFIKQQGVIQQKAIDQQQSLFDDLSKVPALSGIFKEAAGEGLDATQKAFEHLAKETLGAAAPKGLLVDQAPGLLARTAFQKAQFDRSILERARGQALQAAGFGGAQYNLGGSFQQMPFQDSLGGQMQAVGLNLQGAGLEAQLASLQAGQQQGALQGIGSLLGGALA